MTANVWLQKMIDFLTTAFEAEEIPHSRIKNKEGVVIRNGRCLETDGLRV